MSLYCLEFIEFLECLDSCLSSIWGTMTIILQIYFLPLSLSHLLCYSVMCVLVHLMVSHMCLKLCSLFCILFLSDTDSIISTVLSESLMTLGSTYSNCCWIPVVFFFISIIVLFSSKICFFFIIFLDWYSNFVHTSYSLFLLVFFTDFFSL